MLVISRKSGEYLVLNENIFIKVMNVVEGGEEGDKVRLAIEAPDDVKIARGELLMGREEMRRKMNSIHSERLGKRTERQLRQRGLISEGQAEGSAS